MSQWTLTGKVILITGGAGGIGAATARALAGRGALCVLADLDAAGLQRTAAQIGGDPLTVVADVCDAESCRAAVAAAVQRHGGLDVVWANAGIATFGPLRHTDPAAWIRTIDVNLTGAYQTVAAALPAVIERRGYVAVTASVASFAHAPGMSAYAASKAGVEAMSNALRVEVAHLGVDVGTIHPTWIATDMVSEGDEQLDAFGVLRGAMPPPLHKTYPVSRVVDDIVAGFEARSRRIYSPGFVRGINLLRTVLSTRAGERDTRKAAPRIERAFLDDIARRGAAGASASKRVRGQLDD